MLERRLLGYAEHCDLCVYLSDMGWQPYGTLPIPGQSVREWTRRQCYTNCRCRMERRLFTVEEAQAMIATGKGIWTIPLSTEKIGDVSQSVVAAFLIPAHSQQPILDAQSILPGDHEDDLHITLCYLGDADTLTPYKEAIEDRLAIFGDQERPIVGILNGWGTFCGLEEDGNDPVYLNFDSAALPAFRQRLLSAIEDITGTLGQIHGFTPHITLSYVPKDGAMYAPPMLPRHALTFDNFALLWGNHRIIFPLRANPLTAAERIEQAKLGPLSVANVLPRAAKALPIADELPPDPDPEQATQRIWTGAGNGGAHWQQTEQIPKLGRLAAKIAVRRYLGESLVDMPSRLATSLFDLAGPTMLVEVRTKTVGEMGNLINWNAARPPFTPTERGALQSENRKAKKDYRLWRDAFQLERKWSIAAQIQEIAGHDIKLYTVCVILSADGSTADVSILKGVYQEIDGKLVDRDYRGTVAL